MEIARAQEYASGDISPRSYRHVAREIVRRQPLDEGGELGPERHEFGQKVRKGRMLPIFDGRLVFAVHELGSLLRRGASMLETHGVRLLSDNPSCNRQEVKLSLDEMGKVVFRRPWSAAWMSRCGYRKVRCDGIETRKEIDDFFSTRL